MNIDDILKFEEIDPKIVAEIFGISVCQATNLCLKLVEKGKLKMKFKLICPMCGEVRSEFESIMDIPDEFECPCGHKFVPTRDNLKIVFVKDKV